MWSAALKIKQSYDTCRWAKILAVAEKASEKKKTILQTAELCLAPKFATFLFINGLYNIF